jgi:hypothetical protein
MAFHFRIFAIREVLNALIFVNFLDKCQETKEYVVVESVFSYHRVMLVLVKIKDAFEKVTDLNFYTLIS